MYTLVTGATSDIGKAICTELAMSGHKLLLLDLSEDSLQELVTQLPNEGHRFVALDFTNKEEYLETFVHYMKQEHIDVTYAVFAAGIFAIKPLKLVKYEYIKQNFDIALFSIIQLLQVLTNKIINKNNLRSVVFVSSISAKIGTKGYAIYSSVKAGMLGLMHSLAVELAPRVRINAVLPGAIHTRTTDFLYQANPQIDKRYILGEGFPADVATVVIFLLSDKARWVTGQEMVIDGGWTNN